MPGGTAVGRSWIVVMRSGIVAVDWGDGLFQEAISGNFFNAVEKDVSHKALESDLNWLQKIGRVENFDTQNVFFTQLPERSKNTLE